MSLARAIRLGASAFALMLTAAAIWPSDVLARPAVTPNRVPGFESLPWVPMDGSVGDWIRYRVGNEYIQETSYMTLAMVAREDDGGVWIEIRVSRSPGAAAGDLTVLALARSLNGSMVTERMLVRVGGGKTIELDLDTVPAEEPDEASPLASAGACAASESESCDSAAGRGMDVSRRPAETVMTAAGSMRVVPVQVRMDDGSVNRFTVSESVPITGLVSASTFDGTHLEIDGIGGGAEATMPTSAEKVAYHQMGDALYRGGAAGGALSRVGQLVNPDEARREEEARRAEGERLGSPAVAPQRSTGEETR